jgi:cation diffusion facilitator CzcD-associated flavoprotein CzcO
VKTEITDKTPSLTKPDPGSVVMSQPTSVYQSTYAPNTQWTEAFAQGHEIRAYWQNLAKKHNVYQYVRFENQIQDAEWLPTESKWAVSIKNLKTNEVQVEKFDIFITAIGRFNAWKLPDYPGIDEYDGHLRHSSNWDPTFDPTGKIVAVIGNGAPAIQVVPELQKVENIWITTHVLKYGLPVPSVAWIAKLSSCISASSN